MTYRIDLFAIFIFLGIVQAAFLSFFFFSKENRQKSFNVFHGLLLLSIAFCLLEIFLMYTGYIVEALHLVDFSEPFALLIGPLFYFFVIALARGQVHRKQLWIHFSFPIVYTIALIPFLISSADCKYNSYVNAYHPDWPFREVISSFDPRMFVLTEWHTQLVLGSLAVYCLLSAIEIVGEFKRKNQSFWKPESYQLKMLRDGVLRIVSFSVLIVIVKIFNKNDTGDHLFAAFGALLVYVTSFSVINRSGFFKQTSLNEQQKYKSSTLSSDQIQATVQKLRDLMRTEKPFLKSSFSLPDLAQQLNVSVHTLSQVINDGLGKSFFEMTAEYRIEEAKILLKEQSNIKVEEIAEQVGYNSKSSFNTAFKRITGKTPSEFRG
jgi:AraC-like DNA-binding protein/uncharacterized membrane protein YhaH (DUF805 family)